MRNYRLPTTTHMIMARVAGTPESLNSSLILGQNLQVFSVIIDMLAQIRSTIHLQWILGHSDVPGNEAPN